MSATDIIHGMRHFLSDPKNWYQGDYVPGENKIGDDCPHCILAAYKKFSHHGEPASRAFGLLENALPKKFKNEPNLLAPNLLAPIARFNDDPSTTHADILALLDRALKGERG